MIKKIALPENLHGEWIWSDSGLGDDDSYRFFRRELNLDNIPDEAEMLISAHSAYHVFINGRHIGYGPPPASRETSYAEVYDISYFLEIGLNIIAVAVHGSIYPQYSCYNKYPGFWCQININGNSTLWTDNRWRIYEGECFKTNKPLRAAGLGFTENIDFTEYPHDWMEATFDDTVWKSPDVLRSLQTMEGTLAASPVSPLACDQIESYKIILSGKYEKSNFTTHVSFEGLQIFGKGIFSAETFILNQNEGNLSLPVSINSDDSLKFFVNGKLITEHVINSTGEKDFHDTLEMPLYLEKKQSADKSLHQIDLHEGWNRILVVQKCGVNSMGFFMSFPTLTDEDVKLFSKPDEKAFEGWTVAGPLRMPYSAVTGSLKLSKLKTILFFMPSVENVNDPASFLGNCSFEPDSGKPEEILIDDGIKERNYIIIDFGKLIYGFPFFEIEGKEGDIIDVCRGDRIKNGYVCPVDFSGRCVSSFNLSNSSDRYFAFEPAGIRYLMLSVRKCAEKVSIKNISFFRLTKTFEEGFFESSDETLNKIWKTGISTLKNCAQNIFLDSPNAYQAQSLSEAMIQAAAVAFSFGDYSLSEKAITEFANAQFENGNIPAFCPSSYNCGIVDYALLWPLWLFRHCHFSGNDGLRDKMLPTLDSLLEFFSAIEDESSGLLIDLERYYGLKCVIDFSDIENEGMITALNALYCRCLLTSADIYKSAGKAESSRSCRLKAVKVANSVRELTWDGKQGLFADSWHDGKASGHFSIQANILALFSGIAKESEFERIFLKFFTEKKYSFNKKACNHFSSYFYYFLFETLFLMGKTDWSVKYMRYCLGPAIESGADCWWSEIPESKDSIPDTDLCHGFGAWPNIFIIREIIGIRPMEPGFSKIYFNPLFSELKSAKIIMPVPKGKISISWSVAENGAIEVQIDSNYPLEIVPLLPQRILDKCTFSVGKNISVLEITEHTT